MSVRFGLLALLDEAPSHGYNLKTAFERRTGGSWAAQHRAGLHDDPAARARWARRVDRRGRRRPPGYRITPAGAISSATWFDNPVVAEAPARDELTIKVLLAVAAGDVDVTALLQRQRRASVEQLQAYTRRKAKADPQRDVAFLILLDALIFRTEAEIRWLDACDARIRSLATASARRRSPTDDDPRASSTAPRAGSARATREVDGPPPDEPDGRGRRARSRSWARAAPARRRCCRSSAGSTGRARAGSSSPARTSAR